MKILAYYLDVSAMQMDEVELKVFCEEKKQALKAEWPWMQIMMIPFYNAGLGDKVEVLDFTVPSLQTAPLATGPVWTIGTPNPPFPTITTPAYPGTTTTSGAVYLHPQEETSAPQWAIGRSTRD